MAMQTRIRTLGIDVSRDWLDIDDGEHQWRVDNMDASVRAFVRQLGGTVRLAIEPTNRFHLKVVHAAISAGHCVYLVDPYRLSRYREGVGVRAKTDRLDAGVLRRYLLAEAAHLTPYRLPPKAVQTLNELLRARAKLTETKTTLRLALKHVASLAQTRRALVRRIDLALNVIDRKLTRCLEQANYSADYRRCQTIPGVGPLNAAALVATFRRARFKNADAFIAFLGLDVRVRESGQYKGLRKLTKRGNPQIRRLLFNAARAGARTQHWNDHYLNLRSRGLSTTAATVAISRKIARLAFAMLRDQTDYQTRQSIA